MPWIMSSSLQLPWSRCLKVCLLPRQEGGLGLGLGLSTVTAAALESVLLLGIGVAGRGRGSGGGSGLGLSVHLASVEQAHGGGRIQP